MRKVNDNYPSEPAMIKALVDRQTISGLVLEPCAGAGLLASPLRAMGLQVITNDIDTRFKTDYYCDAAYPPLWHLLGGIDWVVTNPPYTAEVLERILELALYHTRRGVAMILRLTANEPVIKRGKRGKLLMKYEDNLRYLMTFSAPRPSYTEDGKTDSVTTAWFVWDKNFSWNGLGMKSPFQYIVNWR
jgi:hypothetical protein